MKKYKNTKKKYKNTNKKLIKKKQNNMKIYKICKIYQKFKIFKSKKN